MNEKTIFQVTNILKIQKFENINYLFFPFIFKSYLLNCNIEDILKLKYFILKT